MAAGDLTTLENVRSFMQKQEADTDQDVIIQALITQASAAITRYTERQFVPDDGAERTFEVDQPQGSLVSFAPYELRELATITIDTDTDNRIGLEPEEFRLWPKPNPDGTFLGVRLQLWTVSSASFRWGGRRELTVKGDWGMEKIPDDVVNWCNVTVAIWMRRDVSAFETGMNIDTGYLERPRALPSAVASALESGWKRRGGGP
jgi:hypothetical protein